MLLRLPLSGLALNPRPELRPVCRWKQMAGGRPSWRTPAHPFELEARDVCGLEALRPAGHFKLYCLSFVQ